MEWMSAIDSSFLHVENDVTPMHIGGVSIFEGPPPPFEDLRAMVAGKLDLVPRYRQKVRFVPLAAGRRCGSTTRISASTTTCATPRCPAPGGEAQLRQHGRARVLPAPRPQQAAVGAVDGRGPEAAAAGRCCRRSTTAWSTASPRPT